MQRRRDRTRIVRQNEAWQSTVVSNPIYSLYIVYIYKYYSIYSKFNVRVGPAPARGALVVGVTLGTAPQADRRQV